MGKETKKVEKKEDEMKEQAAPMAPHADVEQDKALIMDMIKQYVGGEPDEEMVGMAKEAYEAYSEMGYEKEEAMKAAGHSMKLAKHMASKKKEAGILAGDKKPEGEEKKEEPKKEAKESDVKDDKAKEAAESKEKCEPKESDKEKSMNESEKELAALRGENAKLKETIKTRELKDYIDEKMSKTKLPRESTKKFKESLEKCKSKEEIDSLFEVFMEGYKQAEDGRSDVGGFFLPEKMVTESKSEGTVVSLKDCVTE